MINERLVKQLDILIEEAKDLSGAFTPQYGGSNFREEVGRMASNIGTATYELGRIANSLEAIQKALTE